MHTSLPSDSDIEQAADAYLAGFSGPPYFETEESRTAFIDRVRRYAARDGFRLVVAYEGAEAAGVGLAVIGHPGDWWRDQVAAHLSAEEVVTWLGDAVLEVVNLAVRPESRGRGIGVKILAALLADATTRTAILSADTTATPARSLYATRGWTVLQDRIVIGDGRPAALMVLRL